MVGINKNSKLRSKVHFWNLILPHFIPVIWIPRVWTETVLHATYFCTFLFSETKECLRSSSLTLCNLNERHIVFWTVKSFISIGAYKSYANRSLLQLDTKQADSCGNASDLYSRHVRSTSQAWHYPD
jgi:hypothetical protein